VIRDDVLERVRAEADIVAIIGEYVKLKRVGNSFRGPCPFHHGKNDNFSVTTRGGYKCFVCGEAGDIFTFAQKHLGLEFVEAVKWVGAKAGIEVPEVSVRTDERDAREPLWEVNGTAAELFRTQLWDSPSGAQARAYLESRGISREDADRFGLGYAPRDPTVMRSGLEALGFDMTRQMSAGLLLVREDRPEPRPRFRDRLMFPIADVAGRVVGFGGRVLGDGQPKYLNSAESEIFSKRNLLYGLNWAKQSIRKAERLIIVEGYFDVIRLMLAGISEVVAPLGTALTEQQAALIRRYTKHVFLLYDSDRAGLTATFRAGDVLLSNGISVGVVSLPDGDDPDTFVAKTGAEGFERAAATSVDVFDRKIQILQRSGWFADLRKKRDALEKLLPTIRRTSDPLTRDLYIARTTEVVGIAREMLHRELAAPARGARAPVETDGPPPPDDHAPARAGSDRRANHAQRGSHAERELVRVLLHRRRYVEPVAERLDAGRFADPPLRAIFKELTSGDPDVTVDELAMSLDAESIDVLQELIAEPGGLDRVEETLDASINALLSRSIAERLSEIDRLLPLANSDEQDDLIREKSRLADEIKALGRLRWKSFGSSRR
jgi:DNA primase